MAAMIAAIPWLMSKAMLMPLDRIRVGINSDKARHENNPTATSHPVVALGTGVITAFSIRSGAWRAVSKLAKGWEKKATVALAGTQLSRVISMGAAAESSERATGVAARKSP